MSFDPKHGAAWEERLHEARLKVEEELQRMIAYINDEVVPEVRRDGSAALRAAAQQMERLAQRMEDRARAQNQPVPGPAKDEAEK